MAADNKGCKCTIVNLCGVICSMSHHIMASNTSKHKSPDFVNKSLGFR